jgi:hypothetical protein
MLELITALEKSNRDLVEFNGLAIKEIDNPSEAVQLNAVSKTSEAIMLIKNPSEAVNLISVAGNGYNIVFIENPSMAVILKAIVNFPHIVFDQELAEKITPEVLNAIHLSLANQVEIIKSLSEVENERVTMLTAVLSKLIGHKNTPVEVVELPYDLGSN